MGQNLKKKRRIRLSDLILAALALLIVADQICVRLADRAIRNTPDFFETVLERADLSLGALEKARAYYQGCEYHQVMLIYSARTCFSRNGWTETTVDDGNVSVISLLYWPPLSKTFFFFGGYYYEEPCCNESILHVTREKEIRKDIRDD